MRNDVIGEQNIGKKFHSTRSVNQALSTRDAHAWRREEGLDSLPLIEEVKDPETKSVMMTRCSIQRRRMQRNREN